MQQIHNNRFSKKDIFIFLKQHFPLIECIRILQTPDPHIFSICTSRHGPLILKAHTILIQNRRYILEKIYQVCSKNHICPSFFTSRTGQMITSHQNRLISLQKKIDSRKNTFIAPAELGKAIGRMHHKLSLIPMSFQTRNHLYRSGEQMLQAANQFGYEKFIDIIEKVMEMECLSKSSLVHGDLHMSNVLADKQHIFFLDFDSSTWFLPLSDIAFCAFRFYHLERNHTQELLDGYHTQIAPDRQVQFSMLTYLLIYNILQRIFYIRQTFDAGDIQWMCDLDNQECYLKQALEMIN